jgi:hypothetical protein
VPTFNLNFNLSFKYVLIQFLNPISLMMPMTMTMTMAIFKVSCFQEVSIMSIQLLRNSCCITSPDAGEGNKEHFIIHKCCST